MAAMEPPMGSDASQVLLDLLIDLLEETVDLMVGAVDDLREVARVTLDSDRSVGPSLVRHKRSS